MLVLMHKLRLHWDTLVNWLGNHYSPIVKKAIDYFYDLYPALNKQSRMLISRVMVAALTEAAMVLSEIEGDDEQLALDEFFALIEAVAGMKS